MTKEEIQQKLDSMGIKYDKRMGVEKLSALLPVESASAENVPPALSDEDLKRITDEVSGKNARPIEDVLKITQRIDGEAQTASGIIIPQKVLANLTPTEWRYESSCTNSRCSILRVMSNGYTEEVREYSLAVHGEHFKELAQMFVAKNNK